MSVAGDFGSSFTNCGARDFLPGPGGNDEGRSSSRCGGPRLEEGHAERHHGGHQRPAGSGVGGHLGRGVLAVVDGVGHLGAPDELGAPAGGLPCSHQAAQAPRDGVDRLRPRGGKQFTWTADNPGVRTRASHCVVGRADGSQATLWIDQGGRPRVGGGGPLRGLSRRNLQMDAAGPQPALRGVRSAAPGLSHSDAYSGALAAEGREGI